MIKQEVKPVVKPNVKSQQHQDQDDKPVVINRGDRSENTSQRHDTREKTPHRRQNHVTLQGVENDKRSGGSNNNYARPHAQNRFVNDRNASRPRFSNQRQHSDNHPRSFSRHEDAPRFGRNFEPPRNQNYSYQNYGSRGYGNSGYTNRSSTPYNPRFARTHSNNFRNGNGGHRGDDGYFKEFSYVDESGRPKTIMAWIPHSN